MNIFKLTISIIILIVITGCIPKVNVVKDYQSNSGDKFSYEITKKDTVILSDEVVITTENRMKTLLKNNDALASSGDNDFKVIEVKFTEYNMRTEMSRLFKGPFGGVDTIETSVFIKNKDSGEILAEFNVKTQNSTGWGTSIGLIEDHANEIVKQIMK